MKLSRYLLDVCLGNSIVRGLTLAKRSIKRRVQKVLLKKHIKTHNVHKYNEKEHS